MSSRDKILSAIKINQPAFAALPALDFPVGDANLAEKFIATLTTIGGKVLQVKDIKEVENYIKQSSPINERVISIIPELSNIAKAPAKNILPHSLEDVELAVITAHFGVAENGALWVTEDLLDQRVLPFISQHLTVVLTVDNLVANMHQAYEKIGNAKYGFGAFIAGPSKTADIEQSLVLGAHGARSMTVFLINEN